MSDELDKLLAKPTLFDVVELFYAYCVDDTQRVPANTVAFMCFFEKQWGRNGERADVPEEIRELLEHFFFDYRGSIPWSEELESVHQLLVASGVLSWISNTRYYWVGSELAQSCIRDTNLNVESSAYVKRLADKYLETVRG